MKDFDLIDRGLATRYWSRVCRTVLGERHMSTRSATRAIRVHDVGVSLMTVYHGAFRQELRSIKEISKPKLTVSQMQKRLQWCEIHKDADIRFYLFSLWIPICPNWITT